MPNYVQSKLLIFTCSIKVINLPPKAWIKKMHSLLQDRHGLKDAQSLMQDIATITKKSDSDPKNTDALAGSAINWSRASPSP